MSGGALYTGTAMNSSEMSPLTSTEMARNDMVCGCAMQAWQDHEAELLHFLLARLSSRDDAEDLLQELFVRLLQQGSSFCTVTQPKAWLYRVARNTLIDRQRTKKTFTELPEGLPVDDPERAPIESLDACLWRNLAQLSPEDSLIIEQCDLHGMPQKDFAAQNGLSLPAAKARLRRAREKLKAAIMHNCQVRFDEAGKVCCHKPR